jgi:hypothetical protein
VFDLLVSCLRGINTKKGMCVINKTVCGAVDPKRTFIRPLSRRRYPTGLLTLNGFDERIIIA